VSELPPALAAALRGERPLLFGSVEINLPDYDLLLVDGAGELMIGNRLFIGRDPTYGALDTIKGLVDSIGDKAPALNLGLIPAGTAALAALLAPDVQGSAVTISIGAIDMQTGLPVSAPYPLFAGELDVATVKWGTRDRRLEYKVTSVAERFFQIEEGKRLSDTHHQSVWPGELGLSMITDVETYVPWGQKLDLTAIETRTDLPSMGQMTTART
jgi:hypothetical protein